MATEEDNMRKHNVTGFCLASGLVIAAVSFPAAAPAQIRLICPRTVAASVCNTLEPGAPPAAVAAKPARQRVPFCAPTATVCNTLEPGGSPARTAGPVAHA